MPRSSTADTFRARLAAVIARAGLSPAAFARAAGIDRSTLSQLLEAGEPRLPRADTLVAIARLAQVSADWLLGLSQREEAGAAIIEALLQIETHARGPADDAFVGWLREAEGYRIRTVPVALPDFVKTEAVLRWEYSQSPELVTPDTVRARLDHLTRADNDVEVCLALQTLDSFAAGRDIWDGLPLADRRAQLDRLLALYRDAYPGLRFYLYDLRTIYSAPFTVFGPKRAVLFLGSSYLVLNGSDHIRLFARRFDEIIRLAAVQPHEVERHIAGLAARLSGAEH